MYTLTDYGLIVPDPFAFGFDGPELVNPAFKVVSDEYLRDRRTYNIRRLVIQHEETGRFFAREYSTHELDGFEWEPGGGGRKMHLTWKEVRPREVTVTVYE